MAHSALKLALRLLKNGIRFRGQQVAGKPGRPQALSLEVTHACIARCIMCNIWKIPADVPNLPVPQWIELLSSELFGDIRELDITGSETIRMPGRKSVKPLRDLLRSETGILI